MKKEKNKLDHLSKSSIKSYEYCPFCWFLSKVEGLDLDDYNGGVALKRGNNMHDELHEYVVKGHAPRIFTEQVAFVKSVLDKMGKYKILQSEKRIEAEHMDMKIVGYIDIVVEAGNKIVIFDYKSGKDRGLQNHMFELALYHWLLLETSGITATHWGIIFPDQHKVYVDKANQKEIDKALAKAYQCWLDIHDWKFERNRRCWRCRSDKRVQALWDMYEPKINEERRKRLL